MDGALAKIPGTDEWWLVRLSRKLGDRLPRIVELESWMDGEPPLPVPDHQAEAFRKVQQMARLNLAEMIVNAVLYRMIPQAIRTAVENDANGDDVANALWKVNDMKVTAAQIIEWMLSLSVSYGIVGEYERDGKPSALITAEHPSQVITEQDPVDPTQAVAALKVYRDDLTGSDVAVLYRKGENGDMAYQRVARHFGGTILPDRKRKNWRISPKSWDWHSEGEVPEGAEPGREDLTVPYVPVFEFTNRNGKAEFEKHIPTMRRINHTILQRMIIIALQAFRQRGVKGVPDTDRDGKEIDYTEIFQSDPGALWILPKAAELWESGQADLTPVLSAVKDDLQHLAVGSQTPLYNIVPDAANGSAEGAALQREGLIFKTEATINRADGKFLALTSCALELAGEKERANRAGLKMIWASPRRSSLTERAEAGRAAQQAGVPWRLRMEKFLELTPDEIAEAESQRAADAFAAAGAGGGAV